MFVGDDKANTEGSSPRGRPPPSGGRKRVRSAASAGKAEVAVVRDLYETETASFWKSAGDQERDFEDRGYSDEVFFPARGGGGRGEGSFTKPQRLAAVARQGVDPPNDRSYDIWFTVHLGLKAEGLYKTASRSATGRFSGDLGLHRRGGEHSVGKSRMSRRRGCAEGINGSTAGRWPRLRGRWYWRGIASAPSLAARPPLKEAAPPDVVAN